MSKRDKYVARIAGATSDGGDADELDAMREGTQLELMTHRWG
jgi:hypothetical protein